MSKSTSKTAVFRELAILTIATGIIACAVFFFLVPSHASVSSISGLAIVLTNVIPLPVSAITMILNILLLIAAFLFCGSDFGYKTVYTSILLPLFLRVLEVVLPGYTSMTGSAELDVVCYIVTVSIGLSILFNRNASSGGLDIVAKLMNRYLKMNLGTAVSVSGLAVSLTSVFFYDAKTVILSILGSWLNGIVLDHFIFSETLKKRVCIVSTNPEAVRNYIVHTLHSGATIYEAQGAFNREPKEEIITIVDSMEYRNLAAWIETNDPDAFVTVYNVADMRYRPKKKSSS
jgi:uncharacterized membrane-anchored protein YitT (DUF2179 family)